MSGCIITLKNGLNIQLDISATRVKQLRRANGIIPVTRAGEKPLWRRVLIRMGLMKNIVEVMTIPAAEIETITSLALD